MALKIASAAESQPGPGIEIHEDFVDRMEAVQNVNGEAKSLLLYLVADGEGSASGYQVKDENGNKKPVYTPGAIAVMHIRNYISRCFTDDPEMVLEHPASILKQAFMYANDVLAAWRTAKPELYGQFSTCVAAALYCEGILTIANTGNTRVSLLRIKKDNTLLFQTLTKDMTEGQALVDSGNLGQLDYYLSDTKTKLTSCLGPLKNPEIQIIRGFRPKKNDVILLTTKGIHFAIRPDVIVDIITNGKCDSCEDVVKALVEAATIEKYPDNMSAFMLWFVEDGEGT